MPRFKSVYEAIGVIHTPFREPAGTPIQPPAARGVEGWVEVFPEYVPGLAGLEGFSHVILIYHFHLSGPWRPLVRPYMDKGEHGVFATRAPARPNPIGISVVRLLGVEGNVLRVCDVDIVDGTPLLDIKPYVPQFDAPEPEDVRIGWLAGRVERLPAVRDDGRFTGTL
ncbi:MAG TPA: tRNA (N6-threonylcarbamoyladenosine(37)-N6)-methyltransferase TrmO [Candidatus Acetothermia bacterium]|nr:tRNA (N6-threonylcarbamoyladenosine(37)-N6)-methyltransferase TrmO [Candidatus Bipolaricaulota bacterium]HDI11005.1 tRNA (N6-threonylcarbamoyladenosine(37)-N6)-methyltransferase TrmO [Candidatus Acetothermia bacterium]